jgi:hypothetical protein
VGCSVSSRTGLILAELNRTSQILSTYTASPWILLRTLLEVSGLLPRVCTKTSHPRKPHKSAQAASCWSMGRIGVWGITPGLLLCRWNTPWSWEASIRQPLPVPWSLQKVLWAGTLQCCLFPNSPSLYPSGFVEPDHGETVPILKEMSDRTLKLSVEWSGMFSFPVWERNCPFHWVPYSSPRKRGSMRNHEAARPQQYR